jgi:hypothetical protein
VIVDSNVYDAEEYGQDVALYSEVVSVGSNMVLCHTDIPHWGSAGVAEKLAGDPRFTFVQPRFSTTANSVFRRVR